MEQIVFPQVIDNTMRKSFKNCSTLFYYDHLRNLKPIRPSIHLHAGAAFAKGHEAARRAFYGDKTDVFTAELAGKAALTEFYGDFDERYGYTEHAKSLAGMLRAFEGYYIEYPLGKDPVVPLMTGTGPAVEFSFAIPTEVKHPLSGDPILYAGKFDMLGIRDNALWVVDEKTTGSLGAQWRNQWDLNSQFTGYCAGAKAFNYPVIGALIRGVGILKTKITHEQVPIYRPDWIIERWWEQLQRDIVGMIRIWETAIDNPRKIDLNLSDACSAYGTCIFKDLCLSNDPENWIPGNYDVRVWNPLAARGDVE